MARFRRLIPYDNENIFTQLLTENFHFGNPLDIFQRQLKKGVFTDLWEKEKRLEEAVADRDMLQYYRELLDVLKARKQIPSSYTFRMNEIDHLSESEITSIEDLEVNNFS